MAIPSCYDVTLSNPLKPDGNSYAYCLAAEIRALKAKNLEARDITEGGTGAGSAQEAINNLTQVSSAVAGQVLTKVGTDAAWSTPSGAGIGDVSGPISAVDDNLAVFEGTTGKVIADSGIQAGSLVNLTSLQYLTNKKMLGGCDWNGNTIEEVYGGTGNFDYVKGDILYSGAADSLARLPIGTAGKVLAVSATGVPEWVVAPSGGGAGASGNLLSVLDYGATGDGVTNDTTAIQNCINDCFSTGKNMLVPAGTYLVTALTMSSDTYAQHFSIFGEGRNKTIIRKYATSSAVLLTIGDSTPAIFQANVTIEGITFDGLNTTTAATVRSYDMVRSSFKDCTFYRGAIAYESYGAVANQFYNCTFDGASYGVKLLWVAGLTSSPNETLFNGCQLINNTLWGLYFEHGALCVLDSCEIEGNGTAGNSSTGGVYVASLEVLAPSLTNSMGVIAQNCWCEGNAGRASFYFVDGRNTVENCYFIANPNSTYDLYVNGGTYKAVNNSFANAKSYNIYETASSAVGSVVADNVGSGFTPTVRFQATQTVLDYGGVQSGNNASAADGTFTITFAKPFPEQPAVVATIIANTTTSMSVVELHTITTTGFSGRTKALSGGSILNVTKEFFWTATHKR